MKSLQSLDIGHLNPLNFQTIVPLFSPLVSSLTSNTVFPVNDLNIRPILAADQMLQILSNATRLTRISFLCDRDSKDDNWAIFIADVFERLKGSLEILTLDHEYERPERGTPFGVHVVDALCQHATRPILSKLRVLRLPLINLCDFNKMEGSDCLIAALDKNGTKVEFA